MRNLHVEITSKCNLECVECPHIWMKRQKKDMTKDTFRKALNDYIIPLELDTLILSKDGEPFLHPKLREWMGFVAKVSSCTFDIYTNGLFLTSDFCKSLSEISNKVRLLLTYHKYNHLGEENNYTDAFGEWVDCVQKAPENVGFVFVTHLVDMVEEGELSEFIDFWKEMAISFPNIEGVHLNKDINPWPWNVIKQKNITHREHCSYNNGNTYFIGVTGNLIACCADLEEEVIFGNIMKDDPKVLISKADQFYKDIREGIVSHNVCRSCMKQPLIKEPASKKKSRLAK